MIVQLISYLLPRPFLSWFSCMHKAKQQELFSSPFVKNVTLGSDCVMIWALRVCVFGGRFYSAWGVSQSVPTTAVAERFYTTSCSKNLQWFSLSVRLSHTKGYPIISAATHRQSLCLFSVYTNRSLADIETKFGKIGRNNFKQGELLFGELWVLMDHDKLKESYEYYFSVMLLVFYRLYIYTVHRLF